MTRLSLARDTGTGFGERVPFGGGSAASWRRHALTGSGRLIGTSPALKEPSTFVAEGAFHAAQAPPVRARTSCVIAPFRLEERPPFPAFPALRGRETVTWRVNFGAIRSLVGRSELNDAPHCTDLAFRVITSPRSRDQPRRPGRCARQGIASPAPCRV